MADELIISCPHCNGQISFPCEYLGQSTQCPHCSHPVVLAEIASMSEPSVHALTDRENSKNTGRTGTMAKLGFAMVALVCLVGIEFWLVGHRSGERKQAAIKENSPIKGLNSDLSTCTNDNGMLTISKYGGLGDFFAIPGLINGLTVTCIGPNAFASCANLKSISIPNSITNIGADAFRDCVNLTNVTVAGQITSIGDFAFYGCTKLAHVPAAVAPTENSEPTNQTELTETQARKLIASRVTDFQVMERYLGLANQNSMSRSPDISIVSALTSVAKMPFIPATTDLIPEPWKGTREKVSETMQYFQNKIFEQNQSFTIEAGCIGKSDLWTYRRIYRFQGREGINALIFSLRDLDPSSGTIITQTDSETGRQSFFLQFKCANGQKRCIHVIPYYTTALLDNVMLPCKDEQDAKRIGKALSVLIFAYGGKGELFDSSDSL